MVADNPRLSVGSFNDFYPAPHVRIDEPVDTPFMPGDLAKLLIGPAAGKIGQVVVERNANYVDFEPYAGSESIGVQVIELAKIDPKLRQLLGGLASVSSEGIQETAIRWCDSSEELEFILRPSVIDEA